MKIPALILAGGLGTRLKHLIPDLPKPMAPVAHKPFLYYILKQLQIQGIKDVYLSVGYKSETIQNYFHNHFHSLQIHYIQENEPLGTGGAVKFAFKQIPAENILVINGDTFLNFDLPSFIHSHQNENVSIALKYIESSDRYGFVEFENNYVTGFSEKSNKIKDGWISAGIYLINKKFYLSHSPSQKIFSIEKDFFEKIFLNHHIKVHLVNNYFIDIGIPADYTKAQKDFSSLSHLNITNEWTLFLDRDGVINKKLDNDYVKKIDEFEFIDNAIEALKILRKKFGRIIIVTNQQGIGKGLMSDNDLQIVHDYMQKKLSDENIIIDKIYYAPDLESIKSIKRKPNIGMALEAKKDFPEIEFNKSIMIGDSLSDLQFAHNAGMYAVYLSPNPKPHFPYDFAFNDLYDFAKCFM
ncbi:MAG TPA: HAD-IIIA family hydrolase [Bacteroidia bacterium]|nr:HAD-IIIA family hydrolase [Bacteroidia bacterium]